jgi:hypothetical protein
MQPIRMGLSSVRFAAKFHRAGMLGNYSLSTI